MYIFFSDISLLTLGFYSPLLSLLFFLYSPKFTPCGVGLLQGERGTTIYQHPTSSVRSMMFIIYSTLLLGVHGVRFSIIFNTAPTASLVLGSQSHIICEFTVYSSVF